MWKGVGNDFSEKRWTLRGTWTCICTWTLWTVFSWQPKRAPLPLQILKASGLEVWRFEFSKARKSSLVDNQSEWASSRFSGWYMGQWIKLAFRVVVLSVTITILNHLVGISPQSCTETDFEMKTSNFVLFYSFQSFQSIFGLYMMKQYVVKLRKLFPQFYTGFFVFDVTPW